MLTPNDYDLGHTDNGWISTDPFYGWLANIFLPSIRSKNVVKPIITFMDGHTSHINLAVATFCRENDFIWFPCTCKSHLAAT